MANKRLLELKPEFNPLYSIIRDIPLSILVAIAVIVIFDEETSFIINLFFLWFIILFCISIFCVSRVIRAFLLHKCTQYTVFDDRIEFKQGIFNTKFSSIKLKNIREIHLHENFAQKLWTLGTIKFVTSANDSAGTGVQFEDIKYPDRAYERIKALIDMNTEEKEG